MAEHVAEEQAVAHVADRATEAAAAAAAAAANKSEHEPLTAWTIMTRSALPLHYKCGWLMKGPRGLVASADQGFTVWEDPVITNPPTPAPAATLRRPLAAVVAGRRPGVLVVNKLYCRRSFFMALAAHASRVN